MPRIKIVYIAIGLFFVLVIAGIYFFNREVNFSRGLGNISQEFEIKPGEGVKEIGQRLEEARLVKNKYYFDYYIWKTKSREKLQAGKYELRGSMTVPEIVQVFSMGEIISNEVKVTFPEGISIKEMGEILRKKGFDGDAFVREADSRLSFKNDYDFLANAPGKDNLEGFLFPDTYIFFKDAEAEKIIDRMLANFDEKITPKMREDIRKEGKDIYQIITMASILEKEVKTAEDMKIVSGIFWNRIKVGQPLQSCATVAYVLGKEKKQYSYEDTRTPSPYNTYLNPGLPPGPINNPGLKSILAAIYPAETEYNYFLTDPESGKTVFSKTIEEHEANKVKYGL